MAFDSALPGTETVPGRVFQYVEWSDAESFRESFYNIAVSDAAGIPNSGGILNEESMIRTSAGDSFFGVSFKGDIAGWNRNLTAFATKNKVRLGRIEAGIFLLSDGSEFTLDECTTQTDLR